MGARSTGASAPSTSGRSSSGCCSEPPAPPPPGRARGAEVQPAPGVPHPQGATWTGTGTNFALYSQAATTVEVCLFDESGETRIPLEETTGFVWHGFVAGVGPGVAYGFRVAGPYAPERGYFCD